VSLNARVGRRLETKEKTKKGREKKKRNQHDDDGYNECLEQRPGVTSDDSRTSFGRRSAYRAPARRCLSSDSVYTILIQLPAESPSSSVDSAAAVHYLHTQQQQPLTPILVHQLLDTKSVFGGGTATTEAAGNNKGSRTRRAADCQDQQHSRRPGL
jgi:hypothetical protein